VKNKKKFGKEMSQFELQQVANNYKWGVLFWKPGQTEDEMFNNGNLLHFNLLANLFIFQWIPRRIFRNFWILWEKRSH
jgi:hypothetical protein